MNDGEIRAFFINLYQAINSQGNVVTFNIQAMTSHVNQEVGHRVPHNAITMAS